MKEKHVDEQQGAVIINELLCFVQNKVKVQTQDSLVDICCSFYSKESIAQTKSLLYSRVKTRETPIL